MSTKLTAQQMKDFVRQHFEDFVNNQRADVIYTNMTADFYDHNGPGNEPTDAKGDEEMMLSMYRALPGLRVTIEDMIAEGDKVVCRNVWRWRDARGKKMEFHGFVLWRFDGDKIAERWATVTPPGRRQGVSRCRRRSLAGTLRGHPDYANERDVDQRPGRIPGALVDWTVRF